MAKVKARNARIIADYITVKKLSAADKKMLDRFKSRLIVQDGMKVEPFTEKIEIEYDKKYKNQIPNLADYLANVFLEDDVVVDEKKGTIKVAKINLKFNIKKDEKSGGVIKTDVQEKGTTVVLNQVLRKNKRFKKKEDILADADTAKKLRDVFGSKYEDRLEEWTHSYFEQQREFLDEFSSSKWDEFKYGSDSFTAFFTKQIKNVARSFDPLKPVGNYTTWNPSDIWAAYDMPTLKKEITKNITPKTQNLVELNNLLIKYFKDKKLVGLSLKKVAPNKTAHLKFVNVDTSSMKIGEIEDYKINDVNIEIDNIIKPDVVTTYVNYGKDYSVNVTRAGENLSFNTQISATPGAQGGQSPTKMVIELMRRKGNGITFTNDHNKYPSTAEKFYKDMGKYEKMYDSMKKYFKSPPPYDQFVDMLLETYKKDKRNGVAKLMQLHFYHDAFKSNLKNVEFWTDLLYLGMKVGKSFAPHVKIS